MPCLAKWLTWEARAKYIEIWNFLFVDQGNVAGKIHSIVLEQARAYGTEILLVRFPCVLVPLCCKDTFRPDVVHGQMKPPNTSKQINEAEPILYLIHGAILPAWLSKRLTPRQYSYLSTSGASVVARWRARDTALAIRLSMSWHSHTRTGTHSAART